MNELFEPEENFKTGWIKIFRSIRNHWIWNDERKLKWWIDILLEVNHVGKQVSIGYKIFECKKGECLISLQNWAIRWNVSKSVVNNFFTMLSNDGMIQIINETVTTRLIVCNYESYQDNQNAFETQQKRKKTEQSTTKNEKNDKKINNKLFIIPEILEVENYFFENGYSKESAQRFFSYYDVGNWHDSKGNRVKNWKQKAQSTWFKPENKINSTQNLFENGNRQTFNYNKNDKLAGTKQAMQELAREVKEKGRRNQESL